MGTRVVVFGALLAGGAICWGLLRSTGGSSSNSNPLDRPLSSVPSPAILVGNATAGDVTGRPETGSPEPAPAPSPRAPEANDAWWEGLFDDGAGGRVIVEGGIPPDGLMEVRLQHWRDRRWVTMPSRAESRTSVPEALAEFAKVLPGRYRVFDAMTDATSESVEVSADRTVTARLDLSSALTFGGRVEGPPEEDVRPARLVVLGPDGAERVPSGAARREPETWRWRRLGEVDSDGSFLLRGRRGERLRVGVVHPYLRPAPGEGTRDVVVGHTEPLLRLVRGSEIRFRAEGALQMEKDGSGIRFVSRLRVVVRRSEDPASAVHLPEGPAVRVGVSQPGRYEAVVDDGMNAPLEVAVDVGEDATDLGTLSFHPGSTLRARIRPHPGDRRLVRVRVEGFEPIPYTRIGVHREAPDEPFVITGIGPGAHRLVVDDPSLAAASDDPAERRILAERWFRVDGLRDIAIDLEIPAPER